MTPCFDVRIVIRKKNDGQCYLQLLRSKRCLSEQSLPSIVSFGDLLDTIFRLCINSSDGNGDTYLRKLERLREHRMFMCQTLPERNIVFDKTNDMANRFFRIQADLWRRPIRDLEPSDSDFALVYLSDDYKTFWTLTRKQAEEFNNRQMINVTSTKPGEIYNIVCKVFEDAASLVNDTFSKCLEIAFEKVNNREVPLEDVLVPMMLDEFLLHVHKSTKGKNARVDRLYAISWEMALNRMKKKHESQRR